MAGPLGTIAPTVDPNWAWDTIGWTNQANTGDTEATGTATPGGTTPGVLATPPAIPASNTAVTNTNGLTAQVMLLTTGTMSVTGIKVNGTVVTAVSPPAFTSVFVPPGGTVTLTYTVAPTWQWTLVN